MKKKDDEKNENEIFSPGFDFLSDQNVGKKLKQNRQKQCKHTPTHKHSVNKLLT